MPRLRRLWRGRSADVEAAQTAGALHPERHRMAANARRLGHRLLLSNKQADPLDDRRSRNSWLSLRPFYGRVGQVPEQGGEVGPTAERGEVGVPEHVLHVAEAVGTGLP